MKTHYDILQISRGASPEVIDAAFKALARIHHPDNKETGSEYRFKELNFAHQVLADPQRRREYDADLDDQARHATIPGQPATGGQGVDIEGALVAMALKAVKRQVRHIPGSEQFLRDAVPTARQAVHSLLESLATAVRS